MPRPGPAASPARPPRARRALPWAAGGVTVALALGLTAAVLPDSDPGADAAVRARPAAAAERTPAPTTTFRVASFNALGHSHTKPGGNRKGWESSTQRMTRATDTMRARGIEIVGFQEFEPIQARTFATLMPSWDRAPQDGNLAQAVTSIAWDTAKWTAVQRSSYWTPYFSGKLRERPLVQLRNNASGQLVWVMNTHNPSDSRGNAQRWRDESERIQAALVNKLRRQSPGVPVIFTGDMNDRERFYCPMVYLTDLESASGGYHEDVPGGACEPARPMLVDWIMGTDDIAFSGYTALRNAQIKKASDHALLYADATVPAPTAATAGVERVLLVDIQGLRPGLVDDQHTPRLAAMRAQGASTLRAQTAAESAGALANTVSMLTGRKVRRASGGHGVSDERGSGTIHRRARQYVSGVFDMAHNLGLSTALYSGDRRARLLARTWNKSNGGVDSFGPDNGRRKLSRVSVSDRDGTAMAAARKQLGTRPPALTVVQLGQPLRTGQERGFHSAAFKREVRRADKRLGALLRAASASPTGSTLVIVTSSGTGLRGAGGYTVPLVVWGPGVAASDLYSLNPQYAVPTRGRTAYTGRQPIRTGDVANLVMTALRLPTVPRSTFNTRQTLRVFSPALTNSSPSRGTMAR